MASPEPIGKVVENADEISELLFIKSMYSTLCEETGKTMRKTKKGQLGDISIELLFPSEKYINKLKMDFQ
jgi:hypothetical protein